MVWQICLTSCRQHFQLEVRGETRKSCLTEVVPAHKVGQFRYVPPRPLFLETYRRDIRFQLPPGIHNHWSCNSLCIILLFLLSTLLSTYTTQSTSHLIYTPFPQLLQLQSGNSPQLAQPPLSAQTAAASLIDPRCRPGTPTSSQPPPRASPTSSAPSSPPTPTATQKTTPTSAAYCETTTPKKAGPSHHGCRRTQRHPPPWRLSSPARAR